MRTGADEARAPKYAHVERERRWLVDPARLPGLEPGEATLIEDRYLTGTRLRLRRMTAPNGEQSLKLTKKYEADDPLARPIVTAYLTEAEFAAFAALAASPLAKRRHPVAEGGLTYSVDSFLGPLEGLVLAEIEWPDDAGLRALASPPWTLRDVSADPRYHGGSLAHLELPKDQTWLIS